MPQLTVNQYARLKGITPQAVYQQIRRGTLKVVTITKQVIRIPIEESDKGITLTK